MSPSPGDKESTPLLFAPKGGGRLDPSSSNNAAAVKHGGPHQRRRAGVDEQPQHYFGGKFGLPRSQLPQTPLTNNAASMKYKRFMNHGGATPFLQKMHKSFSAMRENLRPYTMPPLEDERKGRNEYYEDNYNDLSWKCTFGTRHDDGIWLNHGDSPGLVMASLVWLMISESLVV